MAWNKPTSNTVDATSSSRSSGRGKMPRLRRGVLAGVIVVLGAGIAAWLLTNGETTSSSLQKKDRGLIKEVTPAPAPKPKQPTQAQSLRKRYPELSIPDDWNKPYPPQAYRPDGSLKQYSRYVEVVTNNVSPQNRSFHEITFPDSIADQDIALLLTVEPGDTFVGDGPVYDKGFVKLFEESLSKPIIVTEDDTPEQAELKRAVIAAKTELKARRDAGEDIAKVMNDTFKDFRELGLYRKELEDQVANIRLEQHGKLSDEDVRTLIEAANKMLEERGCKPLEATAIFEAKMQMKAERRAAKFKQKGEVQ